jgi:hypothetical protein
LIIAFQFGCETVESSTYIVEHEFECFCNLWRVVERDVSRRYRGRVGETDEEEFNGGRGGFEFVDTVVS